VLSADPNVVPDARFWPELSYEEAIEMASSGAKVLHPRAAEICKSFKIPIHIRSSFHMREGTWIREGAKMEEAEVVGVTSDKKVAKITLLNVPDEPGVAAQIFKDVADKDINIRLIIQSAAADHRAGITFIIEDEFAEMARKLVNEWTQKGLAREGMVEKDWATIAIIGHRLAATPGLSARMFAALAEQGINVDCISSSEMTLSCIIKRDQAERGVKAVHDAFFANEESGKKAAAAVK
jgi:aspartate kinase